MAISLRSSSAAKRSSRPTLRHRAALAWRVFTNGLPWANNGSRWPSEAKANPLRWPAYMNGQPTWHLVNTEAFAREGFALNSLIYSAIMYKARAVVAAPLRAYKGEPDEPEPAGNDSPLAKLLSRPNPYQSGAELDQLNTVYLNIAGNVYLHLDRPRRGQEPIALRSLRPDRTYIVPGPGGTLKGYLYVPEGSSMLDGVPILPEDLIHIKLPNPTDPLEGLGYGLSPISPIATSADIDNDVTRFLKVFFERGANNGVVLKYNIPLDEKQVAEIRERWTERYGGAENWGDVAVLDQQGTIEKIGYTMQEMGFDGIDERNESRILGPFGVPPILLSTRYGMDRSTHSNYAEARTHFWEDTFIPELELFATEYRYHLTTAQGLFPAHDLSRVPALRKDVEKQINAAHRLWSMGTPATLALKTVGLAVEPFPGSDIAYIPINLVPVLTDDNPVPDAMLPAPTPPQLLPDGSGGGGGDGQDQGTPDDAEDGARSATDDRSGGGGGGGGAVGGGATRRGIRFGMGHPPMVLPHTRPPDRPPEARSSPGPGGPGRPKAGASPSGSKARAREARNDRVHLALDRTSRAWEAKYATAAVHSFEEDRRAILSLYDGHKAGGLRPSAAKAQWATLIQDVTAYYSGLDTGTAGPNWRRHFAKVLDGHLMENGEALNTAFGMNFAVRDVLAEGWFDEYQLTFAQPINATSARELSTLLQSAQKHGWTVEEAMDRTRALFQQWTRGNAPPELLAWATERTPPYRLETIARTESVRASNVSSYRTYKAWGAPSKEWWAALDERTRDTHRAAHGQVVGIDDTFSVGGVPMQFPHDPNAPASETINCRCTVLPVLPAEEPPPVSPQPGTLAPIPDRTPAPAAAPLPTGEEIRKAVLDADEAHRTIIRRYMDEAGDLRREMEEYETLRRSSIRNGRPTGDVDETLRSLAQDLAKVATKRAAAEAGHLERLHELMSHPAEVDFSVKKRGSLLTPEIEEHVDKAVTFIRRILGVPLEARTKTTLEASMIPDGRGFYQPGTGLASGAYIDPRHYRGMRTIVHELSHFIEDVAPTRIGERVQDFADGRNEGETLRPMNDLMGTKGYDPSEMAYRDKWFHPYMGKHYESFGGTPLTEIVSMTMEELYADPVALATKDPHTFATMLDIFRGQYKWRADSF